MDIKKLRQALFLTQCEFAKLVGVSVVSVRKWESGKCKPSLRHQKIIYKLKENNNER